MFKRITYSLFARVFVALFMLTNLLVVSRYLGSEVLGQISLVILNVAIIQTLAEVYSGSALVHFIPRSSTLKIYLWGFLWIILCTLAVNTVFFIFGVGQTQFKWHVLVLSFIASLHGFHNVLLLGKEKITSYNFLVFFQPALFVGILLINVFIFNIISVYASLLAYYVSFFVSLSLSGLLVFRLVGFEPEKEFPVRNILRNGFYNQVGNLSHLLSNRFNYYIIKLLLGVSLVGIYAGATQLMESILIISASVSPLVLSHIANQQENEQNSHLSLFLAKLCFWLSVIAVIILIFLPSSFFVLLLGKDFSQIRSVMLYLSPGVLCLSFSSILSHYFSGLGQQKVLLTANMSGLVATLVLSYLMVSHFGLKGACLTASLAYFIQAFVLTLVFFRNTGLKIGDIFTMRTDIMRLREKSSEKSRT